jgi:hypothetical protein
MQQEGPSTREAGEPVVALSFDRHGRVISEVQGVPLEENESAELRDRVNDTFMGMGYMKENCSPNAC